MVLGLRGSREWKAWLDGLAGHVRMTKVDTIDQALVTYAEKVGYHPPPER
jgi:hypothetical protein